MTTPDDEAGAVLWSLALLVGFLIGALGAIYVDGKDARIRRLERELRRRV